MIYATCLINYVGSKVLTTVNSYQEFLQNYNFYIAAETQIKT